ncbi:MAG: ATP-binding cassette domain-containing protein [Nitrospinae bacterium]|nr:ATP-binding cassette domain-containing protein [Nitrospinota bacterium]
MIEVRNLTKHYGSQRGIKDVSFTVEKGEILGFLGPNGAGKTTTMRILTCFMPATSGTAKVAGFDVFEDSLQVRRRIGYLPETVPLYTDMKPPVYLAFVAGLKGVPYRDVKKKVAEVMDDVGLNEVAHKYVGELSKGYRQRVGLAQALLHDPEVLILDEPTIGLDPRQIKDIRNLIKGLAGKRTLILSTHILPEVTMTCKRVLIINEGKIIAEDTPDNLTQRLQGSMKFEIRVLGADKEEVREGLKGLNKFKNINHLTGEGKDNSFRVEMKEQRDDIFKELPVFFAQKKWGLRELKQAGLSLEDIFIQLVTEEN